MSSLFSIYYLNFEKAFEISMAIDNRVKTAQETEELTQDTKEVSGQAIIKGETKVSFLSKLMGEINGGIKKEDLETSKISDTYEIKMTKSVTLKEIQKLCDTSNEIRKFEEGQLVLLEGIELKLIDEENTRPIKALSTGMFKGLEIPEIQGMDINNIFNSMLSDYFYKLEGILGDQKILIKIPMSNDNEFENKYSINDLLVGKVSIVGVYKGKLNEKDIRNTLEYFSNIDKSEQRQNTLIHKGDTKVSETLKEGVENSKENHHYIDVISIIQPIKFKKGTL